MRKLFWKKLVWVKCAYFETFLVIFPKFNLKIRYKSPLLFTLKKNSKTFYQKGNEIAEMPKLTKIWNEIF